MAKDTTPAQSQVIQTQGYGRSGGIFGGPKKTKYWTPDGREILAIPSMRGFAKKDKDGKIIESGVRDANLDKGWLLAPPTEPKLRCKFCDRWHDTEEEIKECKLSTGAFISHHTKKAKEEIKTNDVAELREEFNELKELLKEVIASGKDG